jgi:uncharacterized protein (DUF427 family)
MSTDSSSQAGNALTLVADAVHNPAEPRHFMRLKSVKGEVTITFGDDVLARSVGAFRLLEVGRDLYDPVFYLPREDILCPLEASERTTHCPLKGEASYYSVASAGEAGDRIAWSYETPFDFAEVLTGLVAFYPSRTAATERPIAS